MTVSAVVTEGNDRTASDGSLSLWDQQRIARWRRVYGHHIAQGGLWGRDHLARGIDHGAIRGHGAYVFQNRISSRSVKRSYRQLVARYPYLASVLSEDGAFGAVTYEVDGHAVGRDLLDSIAEIGYLSEHFDLASGGGILDVGAGYGRIAHRMSESFPAIRVGCADSIPESSALCEAYLEYRRVSAHVLGQFEVPDYFTRVPTDLAIAIHSLPEMSLPAIEAWITLLSEGGVDYLFLVPNEIGDFRASDSVNGARVSFSDVLGECGYDLICRKFKYDGDGSFVYQDDFLLYASPSGKERAFGSAADQPSSQQSCQSCGLSAIVLITDEEPGVPDQAPPVA
jgi:hypothetical protein